MTYDPSMPYPGQQPDGGIPGSVQRAVQLMYVGAGLMVINVIVGLLTLGSARDEMDAALQEEATGTGIDPAEAIEGFMGVVVVFVVIFGAGFTALWVWMAIKNKQGRNWARVTSTVFFGILSLGMLGSLGGAADPISTLIGVLMWIVGLGAVIFMWRGESSDFYQRPAAGGPMAPGYPGQPGYPGYQGQGPPGPGYPQSGGSYPGGGPQPPPDQPPPQQPPQPRQPPG